MWFGVITLFPEMFAALDHGILGRAKKQGTITLHFCNPRDFTVDKHRTVDDKPYGGGPGMVMLVEPLLAAITAAKQAAPTPDTAVIYLSPQGKRFNQQKAEQLVQCKSVILLSGRYEGIDQRVINSSVCEEWSLGDFVLSGGELAAMAIIDATTRLLPGVLGDDTSATTDSISSGLLKYPQYSRPADFGDDNVPDVLLSGNHPKIAEWRLKQSLGVTWLKKPELLKAKQLTATEQRLLTEFQLEYNKELK